MHSAGQYSGVSIAMSSGSINVVKLGCARDALGMISVYVYFMLMVHANVFNLIENFVLCFYYFWYNIY